MKSDKIKLYIKIFKLDKIFIVNNSFSKDRLEIQIFVTCLNHY